MANVNNDLNAFFALLRAGLWEQDVQLSLYGDVNFNMLYKYAQEQSIVGLLAAGIEHIKDVKVPKEIAFQFVGSALQIEASNRKMNDFVASLIAKLHRNNIYALLVKGQGIAQCYERPLWRINGDVDLFLTDDNYKRAYSFLTPLASIIENDHWYIKHSAMTIDNWEVELHGAMRGGLWGRIDNLLDELQEEIFYRGYVRSWMNGSIQIFLPRADEDVVYVFSHILQHFYKEGVGLRQICDWCRLLWIYKDSLDLILLEKRLRKMKVMTEWKSFSTFAVEYLGMPIDAMPFYSQSKRWKREASYIMRFVLKVGNFGHNVAKGNKTQSVYIRKYNTAIGIVKYSLRHFLFFPLSSIRTLQFQLLLGFKSTLKFI